MTKENADCLDVRAVTGYICPYCDAFYQEVRLASDCRELCFKARQAAGFDVGDLVKLAREKDEAVYVVDQVKVVNRGSAGRGVHYIVHARGANERVVLPAHVVRAAA